MKWDSRVSRLAICNGITSFQPKFRNSILSSRSARRCRERKPIVGELRSSRYQFSAEIVRRVASHRVTRMRQERFRIVSRRARVIKRMGSHGRNGEIRSHIVGQNRLRRRNEFVCSRRIAGECRRKRDDFVLDACIRVRRRHTFLGDVLCVDERRCYDGCSGRYLSMIFYFFIDVDSSSLESGGCSREKARRT